MSTSLSRSLKAVDARVLMLAIVAIAVLAAYRFYDYWTTGFYVSDEFGYYFDAVHAGIYSDRWFFGWMNIFLFKILGITTPDAFSYLLPFYILFWTGLTFVIVYKLLNLLEFDKTTIALTLVSSFVLISFVLLALGFLTEPVGLAMAMAGIYFLARYMKTSNVKGKVGFPLLAGCFFGFAAGTREPYNAFLIGGIIIILLLTYSKRNDFLGFHRVGHRTLMAISIAAFVLPSLFFLFVPTQAYSQQVVPISSQLAQSLVTNPVTTAPATTTTITHTITVNNTVTTTTTTVVSAPSYPFYKEFVLTNTLLIFFGGIGLGWGPVSFAIGVAGFLILFRKSIRQKDLTNRFLFLTSVTALGSYLIVSFIYAPDPSYFSFSNYSTLIRFSDTALPAYFLMAPVVIAYFARNRKRTLALLAVFAAFLLIAVPTYEIYAASNFHFTSSSNPFQPGYHSDAATLRNYFDSTHESQTDLVGIPYGWSFTPGVQDVPSLTSYAVGPDYVFPELALDNLTSLHWTNFYIYLEHGQTISAPQQFLAQILNGTSTQVTGTTPSFTVLSHQAVLQGSDFTLYKIQLQWG